MTLFHGSKDIIRTPVYGGGKRYNDYGSGFYCTEHIDLAREWAVDEDRNGYVNEYTLPFNELSVLYLNSSEYSILHWLSVLIKNRTFTVSSPVAREAKKYIGSNFHVDTDSYDIIIGYRADDSYFSFAQDFLNGTISLRQLGMAMKLGELGEQVVLKSERSFDMISFVKEEAVLAGEWYERKRLRDEAARSGYFSMDRESYVRGDIYITEILDKELTFDDLRI